MAPPRADCVAIPAAYGLRALDAGRPVSARVCRWTTDAGAVAVKSSDAAAQARAAREAELISFLGARPDPAYRVQTIVRTSTGAAWVDEDGRRIVVTRWEAGAYRSYDTYSAAEWSALGRCLAALHRRLDESVSPSLDTLSMRLGRIDPGLERARSTPDESAWPADPDIDRDRVRRYLATCRALFTTCCRSAIDDFPADDPQRPIHNDFNQFNYLFAAALPPLIIDWEASIGAPREFEVVRCLNHLPLQSPALARSFLAGYLGVRPLRAERLRWAVDVACLMHATKHWVLQGWLDGRPGFGERLRGAMEMVSMLAREREGLADFFTRQVQEAS